MDNPPPAQLRKPRFSIVWLVPIIAALIAGYLGYRTITERGPLLTLIFNNGEGVSAGQTQLKYKDVALGVVESVDLSQDNSHVIVKVRMNSVGTRFLNDHARFWVVRPNFSAGNISGLDTLVSGAYITVDPGGPGGQYRDNFTGLEEPPGIRSDEPGHTFILKAENVGSLNTGSPISYRDVTVGEVLGYDIGDGLGPVTVNIFVRAPYDKLVRPESHFWNSSGITAGIKNGAFHLEVQSLQAVFAGGITFDLPPDAADTSPSPNNAVFPLYASAADAQAAGFERKIPLVTYFTSSVGGLAPGAPVNVLGLQVGQVTDVKLIVDPAIGKVKVRVGFEMQPERLFKTKVLLSGMSMQQGMQLMVNQGLRAELDTANYVTGQQVISMAFVPDAPHATVTAEGDALVIPSQGGGFDKIIASLTNISNNLAKIPFGEIGDNVNKLVVTANSTLSGPQLKQSLASLTSTLNSANAALKSATVTLDGITRNYGNDSDFQRNLEQLMGHANNTLRSIDLLTNYLNRHPEALLRGRSGQ